MLLNHGLTTLKEIKRIWPTTDTQPTTQPTQLPNEWGKSIKSTHFLESPLLIKKEKNPNIHQKRLRLHIIPMQIDDYNDIFN